MSGQSRVIDSRNSHHPPTLAHYQLLAAIGSGAMGDVYQARNTLTGLTVAIKIIHPHLQRHREFVQRFEREGAIAAALTSPHVVRVYEVRTAGGYLFMAMEYVDGGRLSDRLRSGPLPLPQALAIASQVAVALQAAMALKVVHRDIKPDNILLTRDGLAKVADFGIARLLDDVKLTRPDQFMGTLSHAAPEQLTGLADIRADIYALGVTLFQMLSGEVPFKAATVNELIRLQRSAPPPLERLRHQPPAVVAIIGRCLCKAPAERYQSPIDLYRALEAVRQGLSAPAPVLRPAPAAAAVAPLDRPALTDQHQALLLLGGLALLVLIVTFTLVLVYTIR